MEPYWTRLFAVAVAAALGLLSHRLAYSQAVADSPVRSLIPWLLQEETALRGLPFPEIISAATGKKVIAINRDNPDDRRAITAIGKACDETLKRLNAKDSAIQGIARINEVSSHVED